MRSKTVKLLAVLVVVAHSVLGQQPETYWPQWRGPTGNGVAPHADPPTEWSETENVAWKIELPGRGSSTPVVWGDRLYVTTAIPVGDGPARADAADPPGAGQGPPRVVPATRAQRFTVLAIERETGKTVWQTVVREELPHEGTHVAGTFASASPITDGERLWAFFGSRGLYCLDLEGRVLWERDFGDMQTHLSFGEGASPALDGDVIVVPWDHSGDSFIVALDKRSGNELWRAERDELTAWATPLVVEHEGAAQVVTSATNRVRSYELTTGKLLWQSSGMTRNVIPSPVAAAGLVYVASGFRGSALQAIRLGAARGDIDGTEAIVWAMDRDTPYTPSPVLYRGTLYFLKVNSNILSAVDAASGTVHYQERLEGLGDVFSSPVAAAGRVYVTDRRGRTAVLADGPSLKILAVNALDDEFDASAAIVGDEIYLRGRNLYRISRSSHQRP